MNIFAISLKTIPSTQLLAELNALLTPDVEGLVVGMPLNLKGEQHRKAQDIIGVISTIKTEFPDLKIFEIDERFTSKIAQQLLIQSGIKKEKRKEKGLIDAKAAELILQTFLDQRR